MVTFWGLTGVKRQKVGIYHLPMQDNSKFNVFGKKNKHNYNDLIFREIFPWNED